MLTAIDLFCGAGGLSLGLKSAGFKTLLAVDNDVDACESYRKAMPGANVQPGDVRSMRFSQWRGVDVVAGGPPCQPFSTGGRRKGRFDERDLLPEFVRAVSEAMPRAFLLENVPGLASEAHRAYLHEVMLPLSESYNISGPLTLNAADFGVPQSRRRVIMVGLLQGAFSMPPGRSSKHKPAGEVLTMKPVGEPNLSKIVYAKNPDPRPSPYHGQLFNGGGRPIDLTLPAPTILASAGGNKTHFIDVGNRVPPYHRHLMRGGKPRVGELEQARRITVLESALLQTFPASMQFVGSRSSQYTQVGNAVPPRLAAIIAEALASRLVRHRRRPAAVLEGQAVLV